MAVLEIVKIFSCGETEVDKVTATLYNNGNFILRGIGSDLLEFVGATA